MDISDELAESSPRLPQRSVDRPRVRCVSKKDPTHKEPGE